jgi:threonine dehydratase
VIELADVEAAAERVADVRHRTPLERSGTFSAMTGAEVYLKLELLQRTGAFKIRGATNRIATLSAEGREAGVVAASAGNHAQGVALAASREGVEATIVMPENAPVAKVQATEGYGADVVLAGADYDAAEARAHELEAEAGYTYVHAFEDQQVMAGQGTIGLEIAEDLPEVDTVVVPIGGGGLISGIATAIEARTDARVIGVQAEGAATVPQSLEAGEITSRETVDTIADGIATRRVGERPFEVIEARVDEVLTVSDPQIAVAITTLLERGKLLAEGAGAVPLAALLEGEFDYEPDERIALTLCGGNIDLNVLSTVLTRGLVESGRYLRIRTELDDRPGALDELVAVLADARANIYAIRHDRTSRDVGMTAAEVELDLETRGRAHVDTLLETLRGRGYSVAVLV